MFQPGRGNPSMIQGRRVEREVDEELSFHLSKNADELKAAA
jgi:hypothetical protein